MELLKIIALVIVSVAAISLLRQHNATYAVLASIVAVALLSLYLLSLLSPVIDYFKELAAFSETADFGCLIKAVGIGLISQTAADLCTESGQQALCGKVLLAGKAAILLATLPLFQSMFTILNNLLA